MSPSLIKPSVLARNVTLIKNQQYWRATSTELVVRLAAVLHRNIVCPLGWPTFVEPALAHPVLMNSVLRQGSS